MWLDIEGLLLDLDYYSHIVVRQVSWDGSWWMYGFQTVLGEEVMLLQYPTIDQALTARTELALKIVALKDAECKCQQ